MKLIFFFLLLIAALFGVCSTQPIYRLLQRIPHAYLNLVAVDVSDGQKTIATAGQDGICRTYTHNGSSYILISSWN